MDLTFSRRSVISGLCSLGLAASVPTVDAQQTVSVTDWPQVNYDAANLGHSQTAGIAIPIDGMESVWSTSLDQYGKSSPVIANETVYVGSGIDGAEEDPATVYALDAEDGSVQWSLETGDGYTTAPAVADGTVYIGGNDQNDEDVAEPHGALYAIDATDGTIQWTVETNDWIFFHPTVADGTVFISVLGENLVAIDADDGTVQWRFQAINGFSLSPPSYADGTVYAGSEGGQSGGVMYAIDASSGEELWSFGVNSSVESAPAIADGTVFFGADRFYAVDAADGTEQWSFDAETTESPAVADGTVYVGALGTVHALNADDGSEQWSYDFGVRAPPIISEDVLFVSSDFGINALDTSDGTELWGTGSRTDLSTGTQTPAVADGTLYYTDNAVHAAVEQIASPTPTATSTPTTTLTQTATSTSTETSTPTVIAEQSGGTTRSPTLTPTPESSSFFQRFDAGSLLALIGGLFLGIIGFYRKLRQDDDEE